tara:strand:+ start:506 stop:886 length:381 start_codon:yes stop_codon:yes gene_type:complete
MDSRKMKILKLLKLISKTDDDNLISAEKLFVANRVLSLAYQQVDDGIITVDNLSSYVQALIEYRDDKLQFNFKIDEQTGEEQVYFTRDDASLYRDLYAKMFRPSFQNNNLTGDDYAEEEEDDSEGS